jgi:hypothetical protein
MLATGRTTERSEFECRKINIFLFSTSSILVLVTTASYPIGTEGPFPRSKAAGMIS